MMCTSGLCPSCGSLRDTFRKYGREMIESHGPRGELCPGTHKAPQREPRLYYTVVHVFDPWPEFASLDTATGADLDRIAACVGVFRWHNPIETDRHFRRRVREEIEDRR